MNVSVSEAVAAVSDFLDEEYQTVNQYARQLINAGMLPKSRGRAIATVSTAQLMRLVLAVALRPKYAETAKLTRKYWGLKLDGVPESAPSNLKQTVGGFLTSAANLLGADPAKLEAEARQLRENERAAEIEVITSWPAVIHRTPGAGQIVFAAGGVHGHWQGHVKRSVTISGLGLLELLDGLEPARLGIPNAYDDLDGAE